MDFDTLNALVGSMGSMRYFPSDPAARLGLVEFMSEIAENEDQVRWLVKRVRTLYAEWPGEHELRAAFCSKFRPKDGINGYSSVYIDGIPSERATMPQLSAGAAPAMLPAAEKIADPQGQTEVAKLVKAKGRVYSGAPIGDAQEARFREMVTAPRDRQELPGPTPQIITQADVDAEVRKRREADALQIQRAPIHA